MPKAITQNYFVIIFNVYTRTRIYMHIHTAARKLSKLHKQTKKKSGKASSWQFVILMGYHGNKLRLLGNWDKSHI